MPSFANLSTVSLTKDRSPYKTQLGAISHAGGSDYYLHLEGRWWPD